MLYIYTIIISSVSLTAKIAQRQPLKDVLENLCSQNFKKTMTNSLHYWQIFLMHVLIKEFIFSKLVGVKPATYMKNELFYRYFSKFLPRFVLRTPFF